MYTRNSGKAEITGLTERCVRKLPGSWPTLWSHQAHIVFMAGLLGIVELLVGNLVAGVGRVAEIAVYLVLVWFLQISLLVYWRFKVFAIQRPYNLVKFKSPPPSTLVFLYTLFILFGPAVLSVQNWVGPFFPSVFVTGERFSKVDTRFMNLFVFEVMLFFHMGFSIPRFFASMTGCEPRPQISQAFIKGLALYFAMCFAIIFISSFKINSNFSLFLYILIVILLICKIARCFIIGYKGHFDETVLIIVLFAPLAPLFLLFIMIDDNAIKPDDLGLSSTIGLLFDFWRGGSELTRGGIALFIFGFSIVWADLLCLITAYFSLLPTRQK